MKVIKIISCIFWGVLFIFPSKKFWSNYFHFDGFVFDIFWILILILFMYMHDFLFESIIRKYNRDKLK